MNDTNEVRERLLAEDEKYRNPAARKKDIIKTVIIIFLAAMLVLTFFSNTIMNKSLPEISTESATSGKLTERIRGKGVVESNQAYNVTVDNNFVIERIHVKMGQEVRKGDVLFTVNTVDDDKLAEAEEALENLKLDYESALLKEPTDYSSEDQQIRAARAALNEAIAKRDAASGNDSRANAAKDTYKANKAEFSRLTNVKSKIEDTISAIDMDSYVAAAPEYSGDLAALNSAAMAAEDEYSEAYSMFQIAIEKGENAELAKSDADAKKSARDAARDAYNNAKSSIRADLVAKLADTESTLDRLENAINDFNNEFGESAGNTYESLAQDVEDKQNALETLIISLNKTKQTDSISNRREALTLESKKKAIDKQQEKVDKMKKESADSDIKSKYDGVISSINVSPNETTTPGSSLATIDLVDSGFTLQFTVENSKVKKLKKGIEAEVMNNWKGDITAVLSEIKNDTTSGGKNKILVFDISGDVDSGESLDISIPCGSGSYDTIVPKSAVKQDNDGKYVLTVRSKSTPLGNRYYVERVSVNEEASDEVSTAVSGGVNRGDDIITASSKPITAGDQVRIKDK